MNVVEEIYQRCLTGPLKGDLTAQNVSLYLTAPYMIYCEAFVDPEEKDPRSPYRELLQERGIEHEQRTIERLYPGYRPPPYDMPDEGFRKLLEEMAAGAPVICGLPLFHLPENLQGRADILERRNDHPSVFGDYHYAVREIKLSRAIQREHILQGAFYTHLVSRIQGYPPQSFSLINHDGQVYTYPFAKHREDLLKAMEGTRAILDGRELPTPTYNGSLWPWERYTNHQALRSRDVSLVGQVGPKTKDKLVPLGYRKIWDIAYAKPEALKNVPGIGETTARKLILSARAISKGQPILMDRSALTFPEKSLEIFLDLEGTDEPELEGELEPVDYLIGILIRKEDRETYRPFMAHRFEDEGKMFRAFLDYLRTEKDYVLYHWHNYERWHLKRLAERHGFTEDLRTLLVPHMIDLHRVATSAIVFPTYTNGLKDVAAFIGYKWRHADINALDAIAYYLKYQQDPDGYRGKMEAVVDYNEDDCQATKRVKDWLTERSLLADQEPEEERAPGKR